MCGHVCVCVFVERSQAGWGVGGLTRDSEVVDEHGDAVGPHQVVGVPWERLVLPALGVTWRRDGDITRGYHGNTQEGRVVGNVPRNAAGVDRAFVLVTWKCQT